MAVAAVAVVNIEAVEWTVKLFSARRLRTVPLQEAGVAPGAMAHGANVCLA
jgi:hypothetical protein